MAAREAGVITRDEMMDPMLDACPSFKAQWESFKGEWKDEPGELPTYLALADLARHLIDMLARGETKSFPAVFEVVEQWPCKEMTM